MKIIKDIAENKFIATFLNTEISSERFGQDLKNIYQGMKIDPSIIKSPNLNDAKENILRKKILSKFRGYSENRDLFEDFPNDVTWHIVEVSKKELMKIKYIKWGYWLDISNNTRSPVVASKKIITEKINTQETQRFLRASNSLKSGEKFPHMIAVTTTKNDYLVILEGHLRLTAYCLKSEYIPKKLEIILGISKNFSKWGLY